MKENKFKRTTTQKNLPQVDTELSNELNPNSENETHLETKQSKNKLTQAFSNRKNQLSSPKSKSSSNKVSSLDQQKKTSYGGFVLKSLRDTLNIRKSLGMKISAIFITSLVVCVATVGTLSYIISKNTLEENIIGASEETIKQVARNIDTSLSNYTDLTFQLMFDDKILNNMSNYMSSDAFAQITANRELSELLSTYLYGNALIRNVALIPVTHSATPIAIGRSSLSTSLLSSEQYQEQQWFKDIVEKRGGQVWVNPQENGIVEIGQNNVIALGRFVGNITKGHDYVLIMEFSVADLFSAANDVEIIDDSYLEIINKSNIYIKPELPEEVGLQANFTFAEKVGENELGNFNTHSIKTNDNYIIVYSQIKENEDWYLIGALPESSISKEVGSIFAFTLVMIIVATLLAIVIGFFMLRMISRPLTQISTIMIKGAKGDLTVRAPEMKRSDEIGVLARTFDEMMVQIEGLARQTTASAQQVLFTATDLTQASHKTATAGKEISIATDEIAAGASALAVEAEKGSDLTQHISLQMGNVNQSREQMNESANQVDQASEQGLTYMTGLIERTGETELMVTQMVDKVNSLSDSTKSIVKILDVLNNITQQTNILSLNAAIEAARAGQAGKGFMVVADEIRQLADQSRKSIDVVGQITATISNEIVETVKVLKQAQPIFQEQIISVKEANQIFVSVRSQMDSLKHNIDSVSSAFDQLSTSQETLAQSMNSVSAVAQQSSATSEEVASLSSEQLIISEHLVNLSSQLETVSGNLKTQLSKFKIS